MATVPPPPPGFTLDGVPKHDRLERTPPPPPPGFKLDEDDVALEAVDGDTLRMIGGPNIRLWGVDAPELEQPGFLPGGTSVPVGQQSQSRLADLLRSGTALAGPPQHFSYGRPVGPVSVDGADVGQFMARTGNAFAAPEHLADDPDRRFDYLQSERLARQNRLGVHGVYTQPPGQYRKEPNYVVPRETVAQFFDTPTPAAGMRPEVEQEYLRLLNDPNVTGQQVAEYARSNGGFVVDPAQIDKAKAQAVKTGQTITFGYNQGTMPLTDLGDGATGAYVRGVGSGALAGGLDEAGAFADMLVPQWAGGTGGRENVYNSDRRWADIWQNNRQQNASILGHDELAHPYATTSGELSGALIVPFGAGARTVPQLARVGGAYGAAEGFLGTEGDVWDRAKAATLQAPAGAILGAAGGKALEIGAPFVARGARKLLGKNGDKAAETASEAAEGYGQEQALDAAQQVAQRQASDIPPPPQGFELDGPSTVPMRAEAGEAITSDLALPRERDIIDVTKPRPISQPTTEAQTVAAAENIHPRDVLPPADGQPLPPVRADEDWGPTPPDFAGNINLGKLDTPQDIRRALSQTERRVGFDAASRGRVTHIETERLASELGMTADDLVQRRKGRAFNAEEALAARQILAKSGNDLVNAARRVSQVENPGDEMLADFRRKWMRHVAIQEQVSGATAEAGRALSQFRMAANSRAVRGDVLGSIVRGGGGPENLRDAAEALIDAVETSPGKFNASAKDLAKPTWRHRVTEYYINALLSGPQTHVVNMVSNTLTSLGQIPEFAVGSAIGRARQVLSRDPVSRITGSEVGARAFGLIQGAKDGAKLFARALRTGEASDFASKVEGEQYKAIPGLTGEIVRVPTRFLTAEDELFKGIARRMELNGQAVRIVRKEGLKGEAAKQRIAELVANPTDEMFARALDYGRYLTFQRQLGPFASKVSGLTNDSLVAKVFLPFVRTPTNLIKFAAERSPAAPLLKEWRKDFAAGGERRDLAVARALVGTGFGLAIYNLAQQGRITGSAPSDPKKSRLLYADGWQPYSVKIGDRWYSYKRLDPFSTTLGVAADLATIPEGMSARQRQDKATLLVASIMGNLASKTWLSGVSDLVSAIDEPERYADNMVQRLVGSFLVPSIAGQVARTIDPTRRQADSIEEALQSRTPGLSRDLTPRRDIWGRPITNEGGLGPDFLSPVWVSTQLSDPVNSELLKLDYAPGYPSKKVGGRELSPSDYDRYQAMSGSLAHERLAQLVSSPGWYALGYEAKAKAAKRTVDLAREEVRTELFGVASSDRIAPPPGFVVAPEGTSSAAPPPPPGFVLDR